MTTQLSPITPPQKLRHGLRKLRRRFGPRSIAAVLKDDRGAATAEYAVVIMAAVGFAGLLVIILRGDEVRGMLVDLVRNALGTAG
jgi:Flp pilus assembly pilin Flp